MFSPLSVNPTKWPNTFKQFVSNLPANCLSVFGRFVNYLVFSMCKLSWFLFLDNLLCHKLPKLHLQNVYILKALGVRQKKQRYWYGTLKNDLNFGWFSFVTAYKDSVRKTYYLRKFLECRQGSIDIASFLRQLSPYNLCKVTNILNIVWLIFICHYF